MQFDIITIFPNIFDSYFSESILKRAKEKDLIDVTIHNLRDYTMDKHKTVDDTPYGGGAGMVMKVEPIYKAVSAIKNKELRIENKEKFKIQNSRTVLFSAKGKRFIQEDAERLKKYDQLIMICGRYEGVDERVAEHVADEEISIGDYVLTGGEVPAMVVTDAITRLIPGVLGNPESLEGESHSKKRDGTYPQYTKPEEFNGWSVPEVLKGGNHAKIEKWREKHSNLKKKV